MIGMPRIVSSLGITVVFKASTVLRANDAVDREVISSSRIPSNTKPGPTTETWMPTIAPSPVT